MTPKYKRGDRVQLRHCPDPGTVAKVKQLPAWSEYQVKWDRWPADDNWYYEDEVLPYEKETPDGQRSAQRLP